MAKKKVKLVINNVESALFGDYAIIDELRESTKVRVPGAFYSPAFRKRQWDGCQRYITPGGKFQTGLLPLFIKKLEEMGVKILIEDNRPNELEEIPDIPLEYGNYKLRDYQFEAVESVVNNFVESDNLQENIYFPRGIIFAATNAGKSIISAGIHKSFNRKTLYLINSKELMDTSMEDMPKYLGSKEIGFVRADSEEWGNFTVAMVPTLSKRLSNKGRGSKSAHYARELAKFEVLIVDECDLSATKTYKSCLTRCTSALVRVGMSGTAQMNKDKTRNMQELSYYGPITYSIRNANLQNEQVSSQVTCHIFTGNDPLTTHMGAWPGEYQTGVVENKKRNRVIVKRVAHHIKEGNIPILVIAKTHEHVEKLYTLLNDKFGHDYNVEWVHGERKDRTSIVRGFARGDVKILVGSMILKRGKNFPLIKAMINAAGGTSQASILQILGRIFRAHPEGANTMKHFEDFMDSGDYLTKHSKRRIRWYQQEKIQVIKYY